MLIYLLPVLAYLLGSVSSAIIVARITGMADPRVAGSRNPGATNILRLGSKKAAAVTLLGDFAKGLVAVALARLLTEEPPVLALVAMGAFLGHLYPVYFGFRGGKGVATALGVFTGLQPWLALALVVTWLVVAIVFRYSSLAALAATALSPLYAWWLGSPPAVLALTVVIAALLFWRHRDNIRRLLAGTETQIGQSKEEREKQ